MSRLDAEIKVRMEQELKAALERKAAEADRKPAAIVRRALREYLLREGYLAPVVHRD